MNRRSTTFALSLTTLALAVAAGCAGRGTACTGLAGASAEQDGLQAAITCCREGADAVRMRLVVSNTSDRDLFLGRGPSGPLAPVELADGAELVGAAVFIERTASDIDSMVETTDLTPVPGELRINGHATQVIRIDLPPAGAAAWKAGSALRLEGRWSTGRPLRLAVPVPTLPGRPAGPGAGA